MSWTEADLPGSWRSDTHGYMGADISSWVFGRWFCLWSGRGRTKPLLIGKLTPDAGGTRIDGRVGMRESSMWITVFLLIIAWIELVEPEPFRSTVIGVIGIGAIAVLQRWGGDGAHLTDFLEARVGATNHVQQRIEA